MVKRSLNTTIEGAERAKRALEYCGLTQQALAEELLIGRATISKFFNCHNVDRNYFLEICHKLELDWQEIFERPPREKIYSSSQLAWHGHLEDDSNKKGSSKWVLYNTDGVSFRSMKKTITDECKEGYYLRSFKNENVGLCLPVRGICGTATFSYKVIRGEPSCQNIYVAMIPMQETGFSRSGYIEVGADYQNDPKNAISYYRKRYFIPPEHYLSRQWHSGLLEFNFRDIPTAFYSIFAPRINEGCPKQGSGEFIVGEVHIHSQL